MSVDDFLFAPLGATTGVPVQSVQSSLVLPPSWGSVLSRIRCQPSWMCSTIAGGALRDLDNGRPVKDVDIFVPYLGDNETALMGLERALPNIFIMEVEHSVHNASQIGREGISHFHFEVDGWKFEISQITDQFDHISLLDRFDIGLCMISLTSLDDTYRTAYYFSDKHKQQISVVRKTGGRELEHATRIKQKYTDWTIVPL
jgi:hypothetical protein